MRDAGLQVVRGAYYFGFVFPMAAAMAAGHARHDRASEQPEEARGTHQRILTAVCAAELPLLPIKRLAGLSAFVLAQALDG